MADETEIMGDRQPLREEQLFGQLKLRHSYALIPGTCCSANPSVTSSLDTPTAFVQFVSEDLFTTLSEELSRIRFGFGAVSTDPNLPIWQGELDHTSPAVQLALQAVCDWTSRRFELVTSHMNLQTHGLDGAFHSDSDGKITHALTWYIHPYEWLREYGGYLVIGDDLWNLRAILPARNTAVLMPSNVPHCATAPSLRAGTRARISLNLKLWVRP